MKEMSEQYGSDISTLTKNLSYIVTVIPITTLGYSSIDINSYGYETPYVIFQNNTTDSNVTVTYYGGSNIVYPGTQAIYAITPSTGGPYVYITPHT